MAAFYMPSPRRCQARSMGRGNIYLGVSHCMVSNEIPWSVPALKCLLGICISWDGFGIQWLLDLLPWYILHPFLPLPWWERLYDCCPSYCAAASGREAGVTAVPSLWGCVVVCQHYKRITLGHSDSWIIISFHMCITYFRSCSVCPCFQRHRTLSTRSRGFSTVTPILWHALMWHRDQVFLYLGLLSLQLRNGVIFARCLFDRIV